MGWDVGIGLRSGCAWIPYVLFGFEPSHCRGCRFCNKKSPGNGVSQVRDCPSMIQGHDYIVF